MAFNQEAARTPTTIGKIAVRLITDPSGPNRAFFRLDVLDQNGYVIREIDGDLQPHLTSAQITGLLDFMADLRTQAVNEVIGP